MVLPNPIDINLNAVDKDMVRINNDGYGSHYRMQSATERLDLRIRHQAEKPNAYGIVYDRHNVDLTWTTFAVTVGDPDVVRQAYVVFRHANSDVGADMSYLVVALADLLKEANFVTDLVSWQN